MLDRLFRVSGALLVTALVLAIFAILPAQAALGDTPREAEGVDNQDFEGVAVVESGRSRWFRVDYPGGGTRLGITFHFRPAEQTFRDRVAINVNVRTDPRLRTQDSDADAPGFTRIGTLTTTEKTGSSRKFWLNFSGEGQTYFLVVRNNTDRSIAFTLSVKRDDQPARYLPPPESLQPVPGAPLVSTTEAPTPTPTARPAPPENPAPTIDLAEELGNDDVTKYAQIGTGEVRWFRVEYPGESLPLGITLHLPLDDLNIKDKVEVAVNARTRVDTLGEPDKDAPGYSRLGMLTLTDDQAAVRKFWLNAIGGPTTYYLRVNNDSDHTVTFALTIRQSREPADWTPPRDPATVGG